MSRPGASVNSTGVSVPGATVVEPYVTPGGGYPVVRPGSVGSAEIADGSVAMVDLSAETLAALGAFGLDGGTA